MRATFPTFPLLALILGALVAMSLGCGAEPGPEELLTLVGIEAVDDWVLDPGDSVLESRVRVTFRDWFNGGVVVETRVSPTLTHEEIAGLLNGEAEDHAVAWEQVMAASTSAGREVRPLVGYRGLIREHVIAAPAAIPSGDGANPVAGVFVVAYLAGIEEVEIEEGVDSLIVTPFGRETGILNDVSLVSVAEGRP